MLNHEQQKACKRIEGPLLIIAWAGSGKTHTLSKRVEYMIKEKSIPPSSIMMVTFTNKAAKEMRERVGKLLWIEIENTLYTQRSKLPLIGTFHALWILFLKETLSKYSDEINIWIQKNFIIYDETDKISLLKQILKTELHIDEKKYPVKQIAFYISNAKNVLLNPENYKQEVDSCLKEVISQVYTLYEQRKEANNALDFDDILLKTLQIFGIPKILKTYQDQYKYIMVDEYQDTNKVQYEITKLLANKYKNLAVVWDDAQSIYSWRWANMNNILNFRKDYPDTLFIKLEQNYRSTKNILSWANTLIRNNKSGIEKKLRTNNETGTKINYIEAPTDREEANIIAHIIQNKTSSSLHSPSIEKRENKQIDQHDNTQEKKQNTYANFLILYRINAQSRQIEEALIMKNIPYRIIGWVKFYDRKEIKDILAYLRTIQNMEDSVSMRRIINTPPRKIGAKSIEILFTYKQKYDLSFITLIENREEMSELTPWAKKNIWEFYELLLFLREKSKSLEIADLIKELISQIWYEEYITHWLSEEEKQSKRDNLWELITTASAYNWIAPEESLSQFLDEIALITDLDTYTETKHKKEDFVTLMTIHTAKWLEEENVFISWVEESIFPNLRSTNDFHLLEEERRLMYVAMTRAKKTLYISRAKERFLFWDYIRNKESRFISEIDPTYREIYDIWSIYRDSFFSSWKWWASLLSSSGSFWAGKKQKEEENMKWSQKTNIIQKNKLWNNDISLFSLWTKIIHPKFWNGIITSINWELAEIAFQWVWVKKMNIQIAPIKLRKDI